MIFCDSRPIVVKVGGSLYKQLGLNMRLNSFLMTLPGRNVLLIPGGGCFADAVRSVDQIQCLSAGQAHRLAIRAMSLGGHLLAEILGPRACIAGCRGTWPELWRQNRLPVLDAEELLMLVADLPECWEVTSDSLAAKVARRIDASDLWLLKSVSLPPGSSWASAAKLGMVDPYFPALLSDTGQQAGHRFEVHWVNLREEYMPTEDCFDQVIFPAASAG